MAVQAHSRRLSYGRVNPHRYRWDLSLHSLPGSSVYARNDDEAGHPLRNSERQQYEAHPTEYGRRLMEPIVLAAQFGLWGDVADDSRTPDDVRRDASRLLAEATPVAENDISLWFSAIDPWRDTLALWLLSAEPYAMTGLRDMVFSLALRYGAIASRDGAVLGHTHPFYRRPLVSGNAQLAGGLWRCATHPKVIPGLVENASAARGRDGSWSDFGHAAPGDPLTTLAAADVLSRLDPDFDPEPTMKWFLRRQEPDGWWRALDPEVPWLTRAVAEWLEASSGPFSDRFVWPSTPIWSRDRLSRLPGLATLTELETALHGLPALGRLPMEAAFVDLAGFGEWNKDQGQARGDDVIKALGHSLDLRAGCLSRSHRWR